MDQPADDLSEAAPAAPHSSPSPRMLRIVPGLTSILAAALAGVWLESWTGGHVLASVISQVDVIKLIGASIVAGVALGVFRLVQGPFRISVGSVRVVGAAACALCWLVCVAALVALDRLV